VNLGLEGKRALVTAASQGLGFAVARALSKEGAEVAICSRDLDRARAAAGRIGAGTGRQVHGFAADVSSAGDLERLFDEVAGGLGGLDVVVCNAGGPPFGTFKSVTEAEWDRAYQLTLLSVARSVRLALPHFQKAGGGRVLAIASSSVKRPIDSLLLSNVFRPAVQALCKALSIELAGDGVQINVLAPGRILTERSGQLDETQAKRQGVSVEEIRRRTVANIPMGRLGEPEEFGNAAAFLCSPAAYYINGVTLLVDGGMVTSL
jgi:3-oxoacyl-[acyl-carrier protein] reductase